MKPGSMSMVGARENTNARMTTDIQHDVAWFWGPAHPICFTDEVMEHQFLEVFKTINIEQYDGTTDSYVD